VCGPGKKSRVCGNDWSFRRDQPTDFKRFPKKNAGLFAP
jgi:hypothetical protein